MNEFNYFIMDNSIHALFKPLYAKFERDPKAVAFQQKNVPSGTVRILYLLLGIRKYSFVDKVTSKEVSGVSFTFTDSVQQTKGDELGLTLQSFSTSDPVMFKEYEEMRPPPYLVFVDFKIKKKNTQLKQIWAGPVENIFFKKKD